MAAKSRETQANPSLSPLVKHSNREIMIKILAEMRVQTLMMAQQYGITDDISALRDDVMATATRTVTDL